MTKPRIKHHTFEVTDSEEHKNLVGDECTICFEEYEIGQTLARLECFCVFHKPCLDNWLSRKQCCPLHLHFEDDEEEKKKKQKNGGESSTAVESSSIPVSESVNS